MKKIFRWFRAVLRVSRGLARADSVHATLVDGSAFSVMPTIAGSMYKFRAQLRHTNGITESWYANEVAEAFASLGREL